MKLKCRLWKLPPRQSEKGFPSALCSWAPITHPMAGDVHCTWSWIFCLHIVKYLRPAAALEVEVKCYVNASLEHLGICCPWVFHPKCLSLALYRPAPFTAELLILLQTFSGMGHEWQSCQFWQCSTKLGVLLKSSYRSQEILSLFQFITIKKKCVSSSPWHACKMPENV